jgi:hypothetical protein
MGPIKDCLVFNINHALINRVFPLCWVAMLSCFTWVMVVLLNINDEHALPLCYIFAFLIQDNYD